MGRNGGMAEMSADLEPDFRQGRVVNREGAHIVKPFREHPANLFQGSGAGEDCGLIVRRSLERIPSAHDELAGKPVNRIEH